MKVFDLPAGSRCALCETVLAGHIACDRHGRYFCQRHVAEGRHCRFCDRFFLPSGGSSSCPACAKLRVDADGAIIAERDAAARWYRLHGLVLPQALPPVQSRSSLGGSPLLPGTPMLGYVERRSNWFGGTDVATHIVVERGLPAAVLASVMAHELGHLALTEAGLKLPTSIEEGSCDWLAHRYLATLATTEAVIQQRRLEQRNDKMYGAGFQWVFARLGRGDPSALIPLLRSQGARAGHSR
jgi:hypothetical protein